MKTIAIVLLFPLPIEEQTYSTWGHQIVHINGSPIAFWAFLFCTGITGFLYETTYMSSYQVTIEN